MVYKKQVDAKGIVRFKLDNKFIKADNVPADIRQGLDALEGDGEIDTEKIIIQEAQIPVIEENDDSVIDDEVAVSTPKVEETGGMGFPRINGKTVDIFTNEPHETIRFVAGKTVPLTTSNYGSKSDTEISNKLKEMGLL